MPSQREPFEPTSSTRWIRRRLEARRRRERGRPIVERLRRDGHSVVSIAERSPGVDDHYVLKLSVESKAVLLTADRDFGEMVIRHGLASAGVVLVRLSGLSAEQKAEVVAVAIAAHGDTLLDSFAVISPGSVRVRQGAMRREPEPDE